jgi:RNA polymerase sigma-70 factor, ECF subfamily
MTSSDCDVELTYLVNDYAETASAFPRRASDPDAALVEQLRRRDAGATETLVSTYGDRVYRLAIRITGNASDAEEVVQDALWAVTRKIDTFRGEAAFGSWVYRITANAAYQKLRGRRNRARELSWESLSPLSGQDGPHVEPAVDWSPRLEDPALQSELHSILSGAIDELPTNFRTALVLRDVEGLSNSEIAETLHEAVGTIKSRLHRARLFLRRRLADYMGANPPVAQA